MQIKWRKNSIATRLMAFVVMLVFGQSVLLLGTLMAGGVLTQARESAFQSFHEKVDNRKDYIQREMRNRWTNMDPYVDAVSALLPLAEGMEKYPGEKNGEFFDQTAPTLIAMLRTTMATGAFVILNESPEKPGVHPALYFRDYDPMLNDNINNDLYLIAGASDISKKQRIPMDRIWNYALSLEEGSRDFYDLPYKNAVQSINPELQGYWSKPFRLSPEDLPIITYTMPLFNRNNEVYGVIGIEISVSYLNGFLPATELFPQDSLGYMVGIEKNNGAGIFPLIMNGALQNRMIRGDESFSLDSTDPKRHIFELKNHNSNDIVYACVEKMGLYDVTTPFEDEHWYLIGLMEGNHLLEFVLQIQKILMLSFAGSLLMGAVGSYLVSYRFTKPIIALAKEVRESDMESAVSLGRIGISEIDDLSSAMEIANRNLLESTQKMSQIINLVNVPIGAFEYKENSSHVFATDRLQGILGFEARETRELYGSRELFVTRLGEILKRPEPEEEDVYHISDAPGKWVRIKRLFSEGGTLGVVMDVTEEIMEKKQIKLDRDYDGLTGLYNHTAFQRQVHGVLQSDHLKVSALLMFDLDFLKKINDKYGHKWGDTYIRTMANQLYHFCTKGCVVGRRSGDEFYVFLYGFQSRGEIIDLIKGFYESLEDNKIIFPDKVESVITVSAGLVWHDDAASGYDLLVQCADSALYRAKNTRKGYWCEYESSESSYSKDAGS